MFTKRDLMNHLQEISEDAVFVKFQFFSTDKFSIQVKCKVPESSDLNARVGEWVRKFSAFTATTWIVRNSFPSLKRMVFRKLYACQRSAFNKKIKLDRTNSRNQGCRAKIDFRVKFINKNTIKNDPLLKQGLNMTITIEFVHSHKMWTAESSKLLKSTTETDEIFFSYLSSGYSPTTAKLYHELMLIDKYGNSSDCLMNATINPTSRHVHYLNNKLKKNNGDGQSFDDIMAAKRNSLESTGGYINYDNPEVIVVITPIMKRVVSMTCLDHILVDSTIISGSNVTVMYVPSKAGALPLACVLHKTQTVDSYSQAFLAVKLALDSICNCFEPKIFTVKESREIKDAVNAIFPKSSVMTSKWSICSVIWRCISRDELRIESKKRHNLMEVFNRLICANNLEEAEPFFTQIKEDECVNTFEVVKYYTDDLWGRREDWLYSSDQEDIKFVEISMRLMKEFIQSKCKTFNVCVMIDVLTNIIENQIRRILCAHINSTNIVETYTQFLVNSKSNPKIDSDIKCTGPKEFRIESGEKPKKYIRFRVDTWCCDCAIGSKGRFCEHLCTILLTAETDPMRPSELSNEEKGLLREIVGGDVEKAKIKWELDDSKMELDVIEKDDDVDEMCDDDGDDDMGNGQSDDDDKKSAASPKSEPTADDNFYYLDVKTENCVEDPLEEYSLDNISNRHSGERQSSPDNYNMPSTSKASEDDLKQKYENAMKGLNNEFRRLNKYFKQNPNTSNMETMIRLARELSKIRPIERVDFSNIQIVLNSRQSDTDS